MSVKVMGHVWELALPANKLLIMLAMADHADHEGNNIYPSVPRLAWKTGYSERQVQRIIKDLVNDGLLKIVEREAGQVIKYRINMAAGEKKQPYKDSAGQNVTPDSDYGKGGDKMSPHPRQNVTGGGDIAMSPKPSVEPSINQEQDISANADSRADGTQVPQEQPTPSNVVPFTQPPTRQERETVHEATEKALSLKGSAYGLVEKYANFLTGRTPESAPAAKGRKARSNGEWYEYQVMPGMDAAEIYAFGNYMASYHPETKPLRKAETLNDYAARFRNHPEHDALVKRMRGLMALKQEQEAALPVAAGAENQPPPLMATPEQIEQAKAAFEDLVRKKRG